MHFRKKFRCLAESHPIPGNKISRRTVSAPRGWRLTSRFLKRVTQRGHVSCFRNNSFGSRRKFREQRRELVACERQMRGGGRASDIPRGQQISNEYGNARGALSPPFPEGHRQRILRHVESGREMFPSGRFSPRAGNSGLNISDARPRCTFRRVNR